MTCPWASTSRPRPPVRRRDFKQLVLLTPESRLESERGWHLVERSVLVDGQPISASLFDFYERAHLNHILAHQDPATGMFTYMTPLMSGVKREFSSPTDSFWCCVGSGMESHAKHADSIYWHDDALPLPLTQSSIWPE